MKKFALLALFAATSAVAAPNHPIMDDYEVLATQLQELTSTAETREEIAAIQEQSKTLMAMGSEVMDIYAAAFPACAEQFVVMKRELPGSDRMPIPELREKFHNAVGLPAGPKFCYYGRAMIYYPFVSNIRLNGELTPEVRRQVIHHFAEAAEHLEDIRKQMN